MRKYKTLGEGNNARIMGVTSFNTRKFWTDSKAAVIGAASQAHKLESKTAVRKKTNEAVRDRF